MLIPTLALAVILGIALPRVGAQNETITPGGAGSEMVETVCEIIQSTCIFDDDKLLVRRMANVESQDGRNPDTYRDGYHGGIWQVDQAFFDVTKSTEAQYELNPYIQDIHTKLQVDWRTVRWEDCRRPLVSALAARLYIQYTSRDNHNGIPRDINSQADFWKTYYRTSGNTQDFIDKSNALETGCNETIGGDIVFVLDGSGSVGSNHFQQVKDFVKNVIGAFEIGPYRFGVIQFGSSVYPEFELNDYSSREDIWNAVDNIVYHGGGTSTHLALARLIDESFLPSNGGRHAGMPKVGIVLTDGQSSSSSHTIAEAERAFRAGITMIAIGVGSGIDETELEAIASPPKCLHLFPVLDFYEVEDLKPAIEKRMCESPIVIQPENNGTDTGGRIPPGDNINCQIRIPSAGATISLSTLSGTHSTLYLAQDTYPSSVYYEGKVDSTPGNPGVVYVRNPHASVLDNEWLIFCNLVGSNGTETNFTFGIRPGDTTHCSSNPCINGQCAELVDGFRCDCHDGYTGRHCESVLPSSTTTPSPSTGYDCDANNPCTPENIDQGLFYFPHHDPDKFVQCDAHGACFVMPCAPGTIWNPDMNTCIRAT